MKVKETAQRLAFLLLLMMPIQLFVYSQTPQGFSYQAVLHDAAGLPLADKTIAVKITLEDASHAAYYTETHSTQTNAQGAFTIVIGTGTIVGGNLFESIPWANGDVSLKVEVDPDGGTSYTQIGATTKLQAVPYALYAENVKEVNSMATATDTDPIFVVKNKAGQIVFAVYQSGVRMYVDNLATKGAKGGFAVGGLTGKASADYFLITPDSARVRLNAPAKGAKGGFAVGGLTGKGTNSYMQLSPDNYFIGQDAGKAVTNGIYNSFANVFVRGENNIGGLVGFNSQGVINSSYAENYYTESTATGVTNAVNATALVIGKSNLGGLVGLSEGGQITYS